MSYPSYERVKILDVYAKIHGQQIYYHKGRAEYSIKRTHLEDGSGQSHLTPLTADEHQSFYAMLLEEKADYDAQDGRDSEGKEAGR